MYSALQYLLLCRLFVLSFHLCIITFQTFYYVLPLLTGATNEQGYLYNIFTSLHKFSQSAANIESALLTLQIFPMGQINPYVNVLFICTI